MRRDKSRIIAKPELRAKRLAQGWIATDFTKRIGISRASLSLIELGKRGVSERVAVAIAQALHTDFGELFDVIPAHTTDKEDEEAALVA